MQGDDASRPQFTEWATPARGRQELEYLEASGPGGAGYAGQAGRQTSLDFQQQQPQQQQSNVPSQRRSDEEPSYNARRQKVDLGQELPPEWQQRSDGYSRNQSRPANQQPRERSQQVPNPPGSNTRDPQISPQQQQQQQQQRWQPARDSSGQFLSSPPPVVDRRQSKGQVQDEDDDLEERVARIFRQ